MFYSIIIEDSIETSTAFSKFGLNESLLASLSSKGFEHSTPIQELTIPIILEGKDIFAQAETGSGKTGSFAIPVLEQILRNKNDDLYIVLSPTRELAQQTHKVFSEFGKPLDIESVCIIGGESFDKQKKHLEKGPRVIVGTPGRICDLIKQRVIDSQKCNCVIFDEADRLFEMGFNKDNEYVLSKVKPKRQLIMVSATNNQEVFRTAYKFNSNPEEVKLNEDDLMVDNINQQVAMVSEEEKMPYLVNLLRKHENAYTIVFCNTQYMTSLVAIWLEQMGFKVKAISGRLPQSKRTRLLQDFRDKKITTLVCTDVAARGLDIKDVNLVVNYDMPHEAPSYVHRVGRTGRAGKEGLAIGLCGFDDCENLDGITEYIGMKIPKVDLEDEDFATDIVEKPRIDSKTLRLYSDKPRKEKIKKDKQTKEKKPKEYKNKEAKTPKEPKEIKIYERFFEVKSFSYQEAKAQAFNFFSVNEESVLEHEVIKKGKKKYFLFGPQEIQYKFKALPIFRKTLLPFLIQLIKDMGLKVYIDVSYKDPNVSVTFSGRDASLLAKDKFKLQNAIKELGMNYLRNKISMASNTKVTFRTQTQQSPDSYKSKSNKRFNKGSERIRRDDSKSQEQLHKLVDRAKKEIISNNKSYKLKKLNPAERRIIHKYIEEDPKFISKSLGDGRLKQIEISLS